MIFGWNCFLNVRASTEWYFWFVVKIECYEHFPPKNGGVKWEPKYNNNSSNIVQYNFPMRHWIIERASGYSVFYFRLPPSVVVVLPAGRLVVNFVIKRRFFSDQIKVARYFLTIRGFPIFWFSLFKILFFIYSSIDEELIVIWYRPLIYHFQK